MTTYNGVTVFHSETGTEGGYWAMQDEKFMGLHTSEIDGTVSCNRCGVVWDRFRITEPPRASFTYWIEPTQERQYGHYMGFTEPQDDLPTSSTEGDHNDAWTRKRNAESLKCYTDGHGEWVQMYPDGQWSYEGLHVLKDGDHLTAWSKDRSEVLWDGVIDLEQFPLFTEDAQNMWIHALQRGENRVTWSNLFLQELPCALTVSDDASSRTSDSSTPAR